MKKIAIVLLAALMLLAISCDEQPQHEHKFSEEWKSNETQHWHECECQEKSGVADHDYETITVESTCSKKGSETVKCKVCGYVKSTKELELKAHTPAEEHVVTDSTCSEEGSDVVKCTVCGEVVSSKVIEKKEHTPAEEHVITDSTCSEEGSDVVKCTVCGEVVSSKVIEKKKHTPAEEHVFVKATCKDFGSDSIVCSVCNEVIEATYSAKTKHTSGDSQVVKPATCSKEGLSVVKCTVCDEVISSTPIACDAHTWEWSTVAESGLKTRTCSVCNATETSGSEIITETAFGAAMNYDGLIYNVEEGKTEAVVEMVSEGSVFSPSDNLVYDIKNASMDFEGSYKFEIKVHYENDYHTVSVAFGETNKKIESFIVDDEEKVVGGYDAFEHPYFQAFSSFMYTYKPSNTHVKISNAPVVVDENTTYTMTFESNYDSSKYYETRYMKITDEEGKVLLEYTLKLVGPRGAAESIANLVKYGEIEIAEAVGMFTVDGVSYDIDSVNAVIANMFMPIV